MIYQAGTIVKFVDGAVIEKSHESRIRDVIARRTKLISIRLAVDIVVSYDVPFSYDYQRCKYSTRGTTDR